MLSLTLLCLLLPSLTVSFIPRPRCHVDGVFREEGEVWTTSGGFVKRCIGLARGGWKTEITACKTDGGLTVPLGQTAPEGDYIVRCAPNGDGTVARLFDPLFECQGQHKMGEEWRENDHFHMRCTQKGSEIVGCYTSQGQLFWLNERLEENGVQFSCNPGSNGAVNLRREVTHVRKWDESKVASPTDISNSLSEADLNDADRPEDIATPSPGGPVPPAEILSEVTHVGGPPQPPAIAPPGYKKFQEAQLRKQRKQHRNRVDTVTASPLPPTTQSSTTEEPSTTTQAVTVVPPSNAHKCVGDGVLRDPEETWISDGKFTKKCTPSGAVIILNCVINHNEDITINVDSTVRIGRKVYKCTRKEGSVFYEEHSV